MQCVLMEANAEGLRDRKQMQAGLGRLGLFISHLSP